MLNPEFFIHSKVALEQLILDLEASQVVDVAAGEQLAANFSDKFLIN